MASKKGGLTEKDVAALKSLREVLGDFHVSMKEKASEAHKDGNITVRHYFEKFLAQTSKDLSALTARINRAELALYRKETKAMEQVSPGDATSTTN